jgi:hypothetical protein
MHIVTGGGGPPGWELNASLSTLLRKKIILAKSKKVWQNFQRKAMAQKGLFYQ